MQLPEQIASLYREGAIVARAPGRINIIGEHTDYNDGFVLPAAIDKYAWILLLPETKSGYTLHAADLNESIQIASDAIQPQVRGHWSNYLLGMMDQFQQRGIHIPASTVVLHSEVPLGAGLSSSAAISVAMGKALQAFVQVPVSDMDIVLMAQQAEHQYAGVRCGIMDMYASMFGKQGHALQLDCRSLKHQYIPIDLADAEFLLINTGVKHSLAGSAYNQRRQECETGLAALQQMFPAVAALRDADTSMLNQVSELITKTVYQRCLYVIEEKERLLKACKAMEAGDLQRLGKYLFETHAGLKDQYAVSCVELDLLVDTARQMAGVYGARLMGGGFGGCVLMLAETQQIPFILDQLADRFKQQFGALPHEIKVRIADGAQLNK